MKTGRTALWRRIAVLGAVVLPAAGALLGVVSAQAQFVTVTSPYQQLTWVSGMQGSDLYGIAVRSDDYLIVTVEPGFPGDDGYMHLLAPWDHAITAANRFGPQMTGGAYLPVIDGNYVYVEDGDVQPHTSPNYAHVALHRVGLWNGADLGIAAWVRPEGHFALALDHLNGDLIIGDFVGGQWEIVDLDPNTAAETMITTWSTIANIGVATNPSGSEIFVDDGSAYKVIDHSGNLKYAIPTSRSSPAITVVPSGCFANNAVFQLFDPQDMWRVANPSATSTAATPLATASPPGTQPYVGGVTYDPWGNVVVGYENEVIVLHCPNFKEPTNPGNTNSQGDNGNPQQNRGKPPAPGGGAVPVPGSGGHGALAGPGAPPPAPALQPSTATQAQTSAAQQAAQQPMTVGGFQAGAQSATSPNMVGVADVHEQQPVLGMSAVAVDPSRDDRVSPLRMAPVGVGTIVVLGLLAWWGSAPRRPRPVDLALTSGRLRR